LAQKRANPFLFVLIYAILWIMKNNLKELEKKAKRKAKSRERKRKPKMKVSGKSVFRLKDMMRKKK